MINKIIQKNIDVWDKWSYDTENECFVFFTLSSEWEDEEFFYCYYKAKVWMKDYKFSDFLEVFKNEENQRTYTSKNDSYTIKCASSKKAWFFHEYEWTRKNRHSMSMEEIRESHGSEKIKEVKRQRIA